MLSLSSKNLRAYDSISLTIYLAVSKNDDGIYAVGSGADFAIGALHAGATPMQAMEIAAKVSAYTAPPFIERSQKRS
jgi:ATP-dependent protease HslVU (ClpYQ) peptidase subunit